MENQTIMHDEHGKNEMKPMTTFNHRVWWGLLIGIVLLVIFLRGLLIFSYNSNLEGTEEFSVFLTKMTIETGSFYPIEKATCVTVPYSPLYFDFTAWVTSTMNPCEEAVPISIYRTGRFLNLIYNLLSLIAVVVLGHLLGLSRKRSFWVGGLYFILLTPHHFAVRPDSIRALLVATSVMTMVQYIRARQFSLLFLVLSGITASLAVAVKFDAIQLIILFALFIMTLPQSRRISCFLVFSVSLLSVYYFFISGNIAFDNMMSSINSGFILEYFMWMIGIGFLVPFMPWILRLIHLYASANFHKFSSENKLIAIGLCVTFSLSLIFSFRFGSAPVYFSDFFLFAVIAVGKNWSDFFRPIAWKFLAAFTISVKIVFLCLLAVRSMENKHIIRYLKNQKVAHQIKARLRPNQYAYAYDNQVNLFLFEKLSTINHGLELTKFQFYKQGIDIDLSHYADPSSCQKPSIVAVPLEAWVDTDYFDKFWPELTPVDTLNRYVLLESM